MAPTDDSPPPDIDTSGKHTIPVLAEELSVDKRVVERGGVRIIRRIETHTERVDPPLQRTDVRVERRRVDRFVDPAAAPQPAYDGEVYVVPVLEEVLVVEKRLLWTEELRLVPERSHFHAPREVELQRQQVSVERLPAATASASDPTPPSQQGESDDPDPGSPV